MKKMNNNNNHPSSPIALKINIPDRGIYEKRFTFNDEDRVWAAKEQVIHELGKESKDIQNYGFFVPPHQGKAGKFMDEGRPLSEYSIPGNDQVLEFMLKRRIYRSISYDENKLTKIHTKANLKKLMELVEQNNAGQVNQFLEKGLDPNFQDPKTGETPLTTAAVKDNANEVIMFLVNGGAYFDYKNRSGLTAVHRAAIAGNSHHIKAFLDLGASPNYRDFKGLTPLYHACLSGRNPNVAELLLGDQADIGVVDSQGWQEIHQVCRYGHVRHLEQLIFYGAEINAQNGSGNTPLHICSLYNQEECARLLLYRGARRDIVNFANQTAETVAVVATNASLSTFIRNYDEKDVVPFIDKPTYSTRRRTQSKSRPTANAVFLRDSTDTFIFCSESLSTTSSTPSAHSETSEPPENSPREIAPQVNVTEVDASPSRKVRRKRSGSGSDSSYATDSGDEADSTLTTPLLSAATDELTLPWRTYSLSSLNKEERGNIPRVKEVKGAANMGPTPGKSSRKTYVAVTNFTPTQAGELSLAEGDLVEVITKGNKGYWQGSVAGKKGWFPAACVEDYKKRKHKVKNSLHKPSSIASSLNKSNTSLDQPYVPPVVTTSQARQVILYKVTGGFGFQMRGANVPAVNILEYKPSAKIPALQYVGDVEPGGEADKRGVKKGDYILEVNGNDVRTASHRHVVSLIRKTGKQLVMKLISINDGEHFHKTGDSVAKRTPSVSPPANQSPPPSMFPPSMPPPAPAGNGSVPVSQEKQDSVIVNGTSHVIESSDKKPPPIPSRAPSTSLTIRPKSSRTSVSDVDFEKTSSVQEDRVISVPRERVPSSEQQWHSPLTGYSSLPRRPKSSYGAIIGSPHASPSEESPSRNFHPVVSLDNTGFTTLPSKENARHIASQDDSVVVRRRPGSARSARDRPKSWMPKVLPTEAPPVSPSAIREHKQAGPSDDAKHVPKSDSKRDKKKRFSFRKKKEKDYMATSPEEPAEEPKDEDDVPSNEVVDNLHIEGEESRPNSLPGLHKRLSTFKPVTVPNRQIAHVDAVSPELSRALEKRKSRGFSSGTEETVSPVYSPGHEIPVFPLPPPTHSPPTVPRAKTLEESIKEEMMRRRSNTAPASSIPSKPRRTFEYKKSSEEPLLEGEEEEKEGLDSELAKAVARRAVKMTEAPKTDTHIYENVKNLNINPTREPRSSVEEPPPSTIEEKLKRMHLGGEIILPTKFKRPVAPPSGKSTRGKPPVPAPANEKDFPPGASQPSASSGKKVPPPKIFPKPKKKSSSTRSDSGSDGVVSPVVTSPITTLESMTSRPMTLPLATSPQTSPLPQPLLSPEMATQFLDDVIDAEVERSNWDTASWKGLSSGKSSPTMIDLPVAMHADVQASSPETGATAKELAPTSDVGQAIGQPSSPSSGKKKYVYKITLVTEKGEDGSKQKQTVTQVITKPSTQLVSPEGTELPPPPPQPPLEFLDESSVLAPVFTPPASPSADLDFLPPPPLPPPVVEDDTPSTKKEIAPTPHLPPPDAFKEVSSTASEENAALTLELSKEEVAPDLLQPTTTTEQVVSLPKEDLIDPLGAPSLQVELEQASFTSPPPAPVIPPSSENIVDQGLSPTSSTIPPPIEFKESPPKESLPKENPLAPSSDEQIVVPPPIFADSTDGQELNSIERATLENQEPKNGTSIISEIVTEGKSDTDSNADAEKCPKEPVSDEHEESKVEGAKEESDVKNIEENPSEISEGSQINSDGSANSEVKEIMSSANESASQVNAEVQDTLETKDEIVVDTPTASTENKEEQASSETVESDAATESSSFRDTPYEDWTCVHVCDWLGSIGMAEHESLFRENDIRGTNLAGLTKEDLRELGVKKLGHRMTIANEVKRLTTNNGAATNL